MQRSSPSFVDFEQNGDDDLGPRLIREFIPPVRSEKGKAAILDLGLRCVLQSNYILLCTSLASNFRAIFLFFCEGRRTI